MIEIRGYEKNECLQHFSKGEGGTDNNFVYGGFFYPGEEGNYNKSLSSLFQKAMKKENVESEFYKFIQDLNYKPKETAKYSLFQVNWQKPRELFKHTRDGIFDRYKKGEKFSVVSGSVSTPGKINKKSGLVFLRILHPGEIKQIDRSFLWDCRKMMVEIWKDMTDNPDIKDHFENVLKFEFIIRDYTAEDTIKKSIPIFKAFSYIAPFDFKIFESALFLSKVRLFERKKSSKDVIEELKKDQNYKDILEGLKDYYNLDEDWLVKLFEKAGNSEFLKIMRKDWKETLKKLVEGKRKDKVIGVFVEKERDVEAKVGYGTFNIPSQEMKVYIFYEKSLKNEIRKFITGFDKAVKNLGKYTGNIKLKITKVSEINKLIPNFEELKRFDYNNLKTKDSEKIVYSLFYFIARLRSLVENTRKDKEPVGVLLLLDTDVRNEDGSYPFWNYFSLAYDFFSLPFQTVNKETINLFIKYADGEKHKKDLQGVFKNLFLSFMKDIKTLSFDFEGFDVPDELTVYTFLEKPSGGFCYHRKMQNQKVEHHYLYEVYSIKIQKNKVSVELENKYILLAGGIDFDRQSLLKWIEEKSNKNTRFCFITPGKWEESYMRDLIEKSSKSDEIKKRSLFVEYEELATAHISEKASDTCFIIYTSQFEEIRKSLSVESERQTMSIALKPADPQENQFKLSDGEQFYHSALQVFSTIGPGWEKNEVYIGKKNLFLLTLLALSNYESESFMTPYAKLELWQKRKNIYLQFKRNNGTYSMVLSGLLYELLYFASKVPGIAEQ